MIAELRSLKTRCCSAERMDGPDVPRSELIGAYYALSRFNQLSFSAAQLWREIRGWAQRNTVTHLRVLDLACGAGDVLSNIVRSAHREGFQVEGLGIDRNAETIKIARAWTRENNLLRFVARDVLSPLPPGYNVIISTLFLHHLQGPELEHFLSNIISAHPGLVLIQDLKRCACGYLLAWLATHLLSSLELTREDGLKSVQGAFSIDEVSTLIRKVGIGNGKIRSSFPCRLIISAENL